MAANPFNKKFRTLLVGAKNRLIKAVAIADACERCDIDVSEVRAAMLAVESALDKLLIEFTNVNPDALPAE